MSLTTLRNVVIILILAALVALVPGGGTGARVALQAASLGFLACVVWFGIVMYRQHRLTLYSLGGRRRAALYGALTIAVLTLTATPRLWATAAGSVAWLVLLGVAVYAVIAVVWSARRY